METTGPDKHTPAPRVRELLARLSNAGDAELPAILDEIRQMGPDARDALLRKFADCIRMRRRWPLVVVQSAVLCGGSIGL